MALESDFLTPGDGVAIPVGEVQWRFSPSGGPGGQHANRASTRVEASLDLESVSGVPDAQRQRLLDRLGSTISVTVDESRSQHRNRQLALERLTARLLEGLEVPTQRRSTKPSRRSVRRRLEAKRRRGATKRRRGRVRREDADD